MDKEDLLTIIEIAKQDKHTKLDLSNRDISEIPEEIGELSDLKELNLSYNCIEKLPLNIEKLTGLKTLLLMRNNLNELPQTIGKLQNLQLLDISHNRLITLPDEIGDLSELSSLDASYCKLEKLPIEMVNLLSLKALYLENNPLQFPNEKIIKRGLYATMHFLNEVKRNRAASKAVLQVFNLPQELQSAFKQYIDCFHEIISRKSEKTLEFDINFIDKDTDQPIDVNMNTYMLDFVSFVKQNIPNFKDESKENTTNSMLDLQVMDIKNQLGKLTNVLDSRKSEIEIIQSELKHMSNTIENLNK